MQPISRGITLALFACMVVAGTARAGGVYVETDLVSNGTVPHTVTDPNLQGAWGLSFSTTSPFWISDANANFGGSGASTVYSVTKTFPPSSSGALLTVGVPNMGNAPPNPDMNGPTGQVSTGAPGITTMLTDFQVSGGKANFIFANLDGTISAWRGGLSPANQSQITATVANASFTGLAIGNLPGGGAAQIYGADQNSGNIVVINNQWQATKTFTDPNFGTFPSGYAAFNVQNLSLHGTQTLFVTFANQSTSGGIVDEFNTDGTFIKTLVNDTAGTHLKRALGTGDRTGELGPVRWRPARRKQQRGLRRPHEDQCL